MLNKILVISVIVLIIASVIGVILMLRKNKQSANIKLIATSDLEIKDMKNQLELINDKTKTAEVARDECTKTLQDFVDFSNSTLQDMKDRIATGKQILEVDKIKYEMQQNFFWIPVAVDGKDSIEEAFYKKDNGFIAFADETEAAKECNKLSDCIGYLHHLRLKVFVPVKKAELSSSTSGVVFMKKTA
jgi:hypothetical protein